MLYPKINQINSPIQEKTEIVNKESKGYPSQIISALEISLIILIKKNII